MLHLRNALSDRLLVKDVDEPLPVFVSRRAPLRGLRRDIAVDELVAVSGGRRRRGSGGRREERGGGEWEREGGQEVGLDASEPPPRRVHAESRDAGGRGARGRSRWSVPDESEISGWGLGPQWFSFREPAVLSRRFRWAEFAAVFS